MMGKRSRPAYLTGRESPSQYLMGPRVGLVGPRGKGNVNVGAIKLMRWVARQG